MYLKMAFTTAPSLPVIFHLLFPAAVVSTIPEVTKRWKRTLLEQKLSFFEAGSTSLNKIGQARTNSQHPGSLPCLATLQFTNAPFSWAPTLIRSAAQGQGIDYDGIYHSLAQCRLGSLLGQLSKICTRDAVSNFLRLFFSAFLPALSIQQ